MKPVRIALAALVLVVMGVAVFGLGMGDAPKTPDGIPSSAEVAAATKRVAAGGPKVQEGKREFEAEGCSSCHAMAASGYKGVLGPRLDTDHDKADELLASIVKPRADIVEGYQANLMPTNYGRAIPKDELNSIVKYIMATAGPEKKGGG